MPVRYKVFDRNNEEWVETADFKKALLVAGKPNAIANLKARLCFSYRAKKDRPKTFEGSVPLAYGDLRGKSATHPDIVAKGGTLIFPLSYYVKTNDVQGYATAWRLLNGLTT